MKMSDSLSVHLVGVSIPPERRQFHGADKSASPLIATRWADAEVGRPGNTANTQDIGTTTVTAASETLMPHTRRDVGDNGSKRYVHEAYKTAREIVGVSHQ